MKTFVKILLISIVMSSFIFIGFTSGLGEIIGISKEVFLYIPPELLGFIWFILFILIYMIITAFMPS